MSTNFVLEFTGEKTKTDVGLALLELLSVKRAGVKQTRHYLMIIMICAGEEEWVHNESIEMRL